MPTSAKGVISRARALTPIGPKARHLNRDFPYSSGVENQLAYWSEHGALTGVRLAERSEITGLGRSRQRHTRRPGSRLARDQLRPLPQPRRARAKLGARPDGRRSGTPPPTASSSLLSRPAADRVDASSTSFPASPTSRFWRYRIASTDAGIMMPELGKRLVHEEGLALVRRVDRGHGRSRQDRGQPSIGPVPRASRSASSGVHDRGGYTPPECNRRQSLLGRANRGLERVGGRGVLVVADRVPAASRRRGDSSGSWRP